jgi:hypothetical protein
LTCTWAPPPEAPAAADQHVALGHGVHLAVGALQRRHEQRAAAQAFRVTHRRDTVMSMVWPGWAKAGSEVVTITAATFFSCSWGRRQVDALLLQHRHDRLHGERGLAGLVAGAVEAHHDAIARQLVLAHAGDAGDVLQALGLGRRRRIGASSTRPG